VTDDKELSHFYGIDPQLLPYFPELLADIFVLGSWPEKIIGMLRPLDFPPKSTEVLDLGCGKGAVSLSIARELGFSVRGVDIFQPFIQEAREHAKSMNMSGLCRFETGDIRDVLKEKQLYDVVVFAAVGGVLGDFKQTVGQLRGVCRTGGYIVIDDGYLSYSTSLDRDGYRHYRSHEVTIMQLVSHGDTLVCETVIPFSELKAYNDNTTRLIRKRAHKLAVKHPSLSASLVRYVRWEESECQIIESQTVAAIWMLQRADSP
jgi:ubiquinone/menaquinone biosynthesis C-methylase UbiE